MEKATLTKVEVDVSDGAPIIFHLRTEDGEVNIEKSCDDGIAILMDMGVYTLEGAEGIEVLLDGEGNMCDIHVEEMD